jgi:hypothetical protein
MIRVRGASTIAALGFALALAACGGQDDPGEGPSGPGSTERPSSVATLTIERPTNGDVVRDDPVELVIGLDGAELVETASTDLRPDQGHLHVTVDGQLISMTSGLRQTLPDLAPAPGSHLVKVEFVANDHGFFDPRVIAATTFEVRA